MHSSLLLEQIHLCKYFIRSVDIRYKGQYVIFSIKLTFNKLMRFKFPNYFKLKKSCLMS